MKFWNFVANGDSRELRFDGVICPRRKPKCVKRVLIVELQKPCSCRNSA